MLQTVSMLQVRSVPSPEGVQWDPSAQVASFKDLAASWLRHESVEVAIAICLNHHDKVIGIAEIGRGTLHTCIAQPRDIAKVAILANATRVIIAHNHPNEYGEVIVSDSDIQATDATNRALEMLGINLADHFVVGVDNVESIMCHPSERTLERIKKVMAPTKTQRGGMRELLDVLAGM